MPRAQPWGLQSESSDTGFTDERTDPGRDTDAPTGSGPCSFAQAISLVLPVTSTVFQCQHRGHTALWEGGLLSELPVLERFSQFPSWGGWLALSFIQDPPGRSHSIHPPRSTDNIPPSGSTQGGPGITVLRWVC